MKFLKLKLDKALTNKELIKLKERDIPIINDDLKAFAQCNDAYAIRYVHELNKAKQIHDDYLFNTPVARPPA